MNQKFSKQDIISRYHIKPINEMPKSFQQLVHSFPDIFKQASIAPAQQRNISGFNQEILVYTSTTTTPLKTAGIHLQDQFQFDEKLFTPQPTSGFTFDWNQQVVGKREALFAFTLQSRMSNLLKKIWYYVDDFQKVQGPFDTIQMDNWYLKGLFEENMRISTKQNDEYFATRLYNIKGQQIVKTEKNALKFLIKRQKSCPTRITNSQELQPQKQQKQEIDQEVVKVLQLPIGIKSKKK